MLLKGPENKTACAARMLFTQSARVAWKHILQHCHSGNSLRVLLPAYIGETDREGSGIFDPVRSLNCDVHFYAVSDHLLPDMESIARIIAAENIDVLLAVHYFGFVQSSMQLMRSLCDRHGVTLVEDCAHACVIHGQCPGTTGDYAFYSLHKFLPTGTGGILRSNRHVDFSIPRDDRCDLNVLEQLSRTDLAAAASVRRRNYAYLHDLLGDVPGLTPMYQLDENTVPHNFPMLVHGKLREELYFHLQSRDMPTIALYYRLVSEIDPATFPVSCEVSQSILNLPVHQDTSRTDLEALVLEIRSFLEA